MFLEEEVHLGEVAVLSRGDGSGATTAVQERMYLTIYLSVVVLVIGSLLSLVVGG